MPISPTYSSLRSSEEEAWPWLMECIVSHPSLQGLRRWTLATRDAHRLYAKYGFTPVQSPDRWMERHDPDVY
ncbi:MAG TPA: hypothetical protein VGH37_08385 [Candidatus Acidoferrum sp.]